MGNRLTKLYKENKLPASDVSELLQAADEAGLEFSNPIPKKKGRLSLVRLLSLGRLQSLKKAAETRMLQEAWTDSCERIIPGKICIGQKFL